MHKIPKIGDTIWIKDWQLSSGRFIRAIILKIKPCQKTTYCDYHAFFNSKRQICFHKNLTILVVNDNTNYRFLPFSVLSKICSLKTRFHKPKKGDN